MTAARHTPPALHQPRFSGQQPAISASETTEATWPIALRALLLLSGATTTHDPGLMSLSDADLCALRGSLAILHSEEPTNIA